MPAEDGKPDHGRRNGAGHLRQCRRDRRGRDMDDQHEESNQSMTRLEQPDGISPSRMAEMLEVDKAGPKARC